MRPDRVKERLQTSNDDLTTNQCVAKMVDLINIYHSVDYRKGTEEEKSEARNLILNEIKKLKKKVGSYLAKNCIWYTKNKEEWEKVKESFIK